MCFKYILNIGGTPQLEVYQASYPSNSPPYSFQLVTYIFQFDSYPPKQLAIPVCLPWKEADFGREVQPGQKALVAGWGRTSNNWSATMG